MIKPRESILENFIRRKRACLLSTLHTIISPEADVVTWVIASLREFCSEQMLQKNSMQWWWWWWLMRVHKFHFFFLQICNFINFINIIVSWSKLIRSGKNWTTNYSVWFFHLADASKQAMVTNWVQIANRKLQKIYTNTMNAFVCAVLQMLWNGIRQVESESEW